MHPPSANRGRSDQEFQERDNEGLTAAACFQHRESIVGFRRLDLPDALAAIATVLLDDPRAGRLQPPRERFVKFPDAAIEMRIGAPAQMPRRVKHVLDAHFLRHVRMRAHPHALGRDIAQQGIELPAITAA